MARRDRTTRKIIEVAHENPHLSAREIATRVGCARSRVTQVLQRYDGPGDLARDAEGGGDRTGGGLDEPGWLVPGITGLAGVVTFLSFGGPAAPLPALLVGVGLLLVAAATLPIGDRDPERES